MKSPAYERVAAEASGHPGYSAELHGQIDGLVQEYCQSFGAVDSDEQRNACREWCTAQYEQRYGFGPLILFWPIIAGIIEWLVGRTLDWWFPKVQE